MQTLGGLGVSPGLAMARAFVVRRDRLDGRDTGATIAPDRVQSELALWKRAVDLARGQLRALAERVRFGLGEDKAAIFEADLVMLEDEEFIAEVEGRIRAQTPAPAAVMAVCQAQAAAMERLADEYLRQRAQDVLSLGRRLAANCLGLDPDEPVSPDPAAKGEYVVVARDLAPAEVALLPVGEVAAIVTEGGGPASHAAILAASLEIPAVVRVTGLMDHVKDGDFLVVDAVTGRVLVNPADDVIASFAGTTAQQADSAQEPAHCPLASTRDGARLVLLANIGSAGESARAEARGAEGVGLFRLEFMYLGRNQAPSEEELLQTFTAALAAMPGKVLVVRILDAGGDKDVGYLGLARRENPALGLRGVRLAFARPDIFLPQLRAALRAGASGRLRLLLPMVTGPDEVRRFRALLDEAGDTLDSQGAVRAHSLPVGAMIETPAAVFMAREIAREADFFSIGANDLTQYVLACDRGDEDLGQLFDPFHPAVLRAIQAAVEAGRAEGNPVCVCGEMAGDPQGAMLLAGLGVRELSMSPGRLAQVREELAKYDIDRLERLAAEAMAKDSAGDVRRLLETLER